MVAPGSAEDPSLERSFGKMFATYINAMALIGWPAGFALNDTGDCRMYLIVACRLSM